MKRRLKEWVVFLRAVAADARIPTRNKAILAGMLLWLASPVDLIPDFIPVVGYLDDLVVLVLLLDYVLNEIPLPILADHFPGNAEALARMRQRTRWIGRLVPAWARRRLWKQVRDMGGEGPS